MAVLELDPLPGPAAPKYLELDPLPGPAKPNYLQLDPLPGPEPQKPPPIASIFGDPSIPAMPLSPMTASATAQPAIPPPETSLSAVLAAPPPPVAPAIAPDVALHQLQTPTPPPAPEFTDPMSGEPMTLMNPPGTGFAGGLAAGHKEMVRQGVRTLQGEAFMPDPNAPEPPKDPGFGYELGHGLAYSTPTLAAGLAGGAAGGAIGSAVPVVGTGLGALVGSGLGVALSSAAQDLAPTYAAAVQRGMTHEDAVDYAWKHAAATGTLSGVASAIPGGRTILGRILFQSFVAQPAGGAAVRAGVPAIMGEPLPSAGEFVRGAGQDVITGLGFGLGHAGAREVIQAARPSVTPPVPGEQVAPRLPEPPPVGEPAPSVPGERQEPPPLRTEPEPPVMPRTEPAPATPGAIAPLAGEPLLPVRPAAAVEVPRTTPTEVPRGEAPLTAPPATGTEPPSEPLPVRPPAGVEAAVTPSEAPSVPPSTSPVPPPTEARAEVPAVEAPAAARPAEGAPLPLEPAPARPATEPEPRAPAEPVPPSPQAEPPVPPAPEPRVTTEPDHLDPTRFVAKNEAGEVIGKGGTSEEAAADAQTRGGKVYPAEEPAAAAEPPPAAAPRSPEAVAEEPAAALARETPPAEPGTRPEPPVTTITEPVARAPSDYLKLDPNIRAEEYVQRLSELRDNKPRPINKLWNNPETAPPERVEAARAALRAWNREYRVVARNQKLAETRDNEAFRARGAERLQEQETGAKLAGETRLEDRPLVPGPAEVPGTTGPRVLSDATGNISEIPSGPERPSSQLQNLTATRDMLETKLTRTPAEERRLTQVRGQAEMLAKRELALEDKGRRRKKEPFPGPKRPTTEKSFIDYKFNDGTSVYRSVFEAAGHNPDLATSRPIEWQNEVLQKHMMNTFGFRDVSLAKNATPVDAYDTRNAMLDATRAIQDLMASLGQPHDAASLNGRLKLVYDPEGKVSYFGAYAPGSGEIHIRGRANSFGHEWTHAIDHLLAERATGNPGLTNDLLTRYARRDQLDPKDGVQGAFARVLNTLFYDKSAQALREMSLTAEANKTDAKGQPTAGAIAARKGLDALESGNLRLRIQPSEFRRAAGQMPDNVRYFSDPVELLARAHEAYLSRQMKNAGVDPRGAVMSDEAYLKESERLLKLLYPKGQDQANIFKAFDDLHHEMRKADVLSQGKPAGAFPNYGVADPRHYPPSLARQPTAQATRRAAAGYSARVQRMLAEPLFNPDRPRGPLTTGQKIAQAGRAATYSDGGLTQVIIDRVPKAAKPYLQEVRDMLTTDPGSGRYTPEALQERSRSLEHSWMRRYTRIIQNNGYDHPTKMPPEINAMIRHGLTTGEDYYPPDLNKPNDLKHIPGHVQKIIGQLRGLMDEAHETARGAGLEVGYTDSFFPRIIDKAKAHDNSTGFQEQAAKVYGVKFDKELGLPGSDPQKLLETWTTMSSPYKAGAPAELPAKMAELNKNLREQRGIEENPAPTPAEQARLQQLKTEATQLAEDAHPLLRTQLSDKEADALYSRMSNPALSGFDNEGLGSRHFSARTLPPETDQLLRDYMATNIHDAIPHYFEAVARRVADAERFGTKANERLAALYESARRAGAHPDDLDAFDVSVQRVRGVDQPRYKTGIEATSTTIHALSSVALMARSAWSSLAEPINAGLVTGKGTMGPRIVLQQFANGFGRLFRTASALERRELVEFVGLINSAAHDTINNSRMGNDYSDTPRLSKFMGGFYRTVGLTQLTNAQRAATLAGSHWFLTKLARSYEGTGTGFGARSARDQATRWFNEMGVPAEEHGNFAKWLTDLNGDRPTVARLVDDNMAPIYGLALRRLADRIIQNPYKVDRAALAGMPGVGLAFQLMSFNYGYQKNVLEPLYHQIVHGYKFAREDALAGGASAGTAQAKALAFAAPRAAGVAAGVGVKVGAIIGTVIGASVLQTIVREAIFSPDKWKEHEDKGDWGEWIRDLAIQRSGLNGTLDPLIQLASHLKYMTDLQSVVDGGGLSWTTKNAGDIVMMAVPGESDTNTRLYRGTRAAMNLIGIPLLSYGLVMAGGIHPAARAAAGAALQWGTSSENVSHLAEAVTGPKGAKPADASGKLGELKGLGELGELSGLDAKPKEGEGGQTGAGAVPWAILDDFISPIAKVARPILDAIPGPAKVAAGVVGAGVIAGEIWKAGAPYRGQPAPDKRATQ